MKFKTILILLIILLIGIAIGFLSSGYLMRERVKSFNRLESASQLEDRIYEILELSSEDKKGIESEVITFSAAYRTLRTESRSEMRRKADSLNQSLFQNLDASQIKKLKESSRIFGERRKQFRNSENHKK